MALIHKTFDNVMVDIHRATDQESTDILRFLVEQGFEVVGINPMVNYGVSINSDELTYQIVGIRDFNRHVDNSIAVFDHNQFIKNMSNQKEYTYTRRHKNSEKSRKTHSLSRKTHNCVPKNS